MDDIGKVWGNTSEKVDNKKFTGLIEVSGTNPISVKDTSVKIYETLYSRGENFIISEEAGRDLYYVRDAKVDDIIQLSIPQTGVKITKHVAPNVVELYEKFIPGIYFSYIDNLYIDIKQCYLLDLVEKAILSNTNIPQNLSFEVDCNEDKIHVYAVTDNKNYKTVSNVHFKVKVEEHIFVLQLVVKVLNFTIDIIELYHPYGMLIVNKCRAHYDITKSKLGSIEYVDGVPSNVIGIDCSMTNVPIFGNTNKLIAKYNKISILLKTPDIRVLIQNIIKAGTIKDKYRYIKELMKVTYKDNILDTDIMTDKYKLVESSDNELEYKLCNMTNPNDVKVIKIDKIGLWISRLLSFDKLDLLFDNLKEG